MKHTAYLLALLAISSCTSKDGDQLPSASDSTSHIGYTKVVEYAVDANGMFHTDLNDEDFTDISELMVNLLNDVLAGKLHALDPITEQPMTLQEVRAKLFFTDTVYYENTETGQMVAEAVTRDYGREFYSVKFREQWRYTPDGNIIDRKVLAIAPRIPVYSSMGGELRGHTSLFWVKVN
ncbi:MAG: hypothetical protein K9J06_06195 [Flavobacteriales bacterium]|nr:hypothetical protein [Flavobacteriales bacterium]